MITNDQLSALGFKPEPTVTEDEFSYTTWLLNIGGLNLDFVTEYNAVGNPKLQYVDLIHETSKQNPILQQLEQLIESLNALFL